MSQKPISEQAFAMSVERKQDDRGSEPTATERLPVAEPRATNYPRLVKASPPTAVSGGLDNEFEADKEVKEAVVTGAQVCHIDDNVTCSS